MPDIIDPWENGMLNTPSRGGNKPILDPGSPSGTPVAPPAGQFASNAPPSPGVGAKVASLAAEYVLPGAVAATGVGAIPTGIAMGAGGMLARQIEEGAHVPTGEEAANATLLGAAGAAGQAVIPPILNIAGGLLKWPVAKVMQKVIVPPEWGEITSQRTGNIITQSIGKMKDAISTPKVSDWTLGAPVDRGKFYLYNWLNQLGSSPTPGQVFKNEWVQFMDQVTGAALFTGVKAVKEQNAQRLTDAAVDYVNVHARAGWQDPLFGQEGNEAVRDVARSRLGQLMQSVFVGQKNEIGQQVPGSLISMQSLINAQNFGAFRREISNKGMEVSIKPVMEWIEANRGVNPHVAFVEQKLGKYLPETAALNEFGLNAEQAQTLAQSGYSTEALKSLSEKARNSIFKQMGMDKNAQSEVTLPMEQVVQFMQEGINPLTQVFDKGTRAVAHQIKNEVESLMEKELISSGNVEALQTLNHARKTYGKLADTYDNDLMKGFINTIDKSPASALQGILSSGDQKIDMFKGLQKAFLADTKGTSGGGIKNFTENVVYPLRYHPIAEALDNATGQVKGDVLYNSLKSNYGQEFGELVYGKEGYSDLLKLSLAIIENDKKVGVGSMFIKGAQTAALMTGGAYQIERQETLGGKLAWTSLLLTPSIAAKTFTANPAATKALIEGITIGPGSNAWSRAAASIAVQSAGKDAIDKSWTEGQRQVYTDPKAHKIVDPHSLTQPEFQFVPKDTVQSNIAAQQTATGVPEAPPFMLP